MLRAGYLRQDLPPSLGGAPQRVSALLGHSTVARPQWRTNGESVKIRCIARLPESERILNREQLDELARNLAMLSVDGVRQAYEIAYR